MNLSDKSNLLCAIQKPFRRSFLRVKIIAAILFSLSSSSINSQETTMYSCRTACNIGIQIADYKSADSITARTLLKSDGVKAEAVSFTILSYKITIAGGGFCDLYEIDNPGDKFTEKTVSLFRRLRRGSFVSIDCITAKDAYGRLVGLKPAVYMIR